MLTLIGVQCTLHDPYAGFLQHADDFVCESTHTLLSTRAKTTADRRSTTAGAFVKVGLSRGWRLGLGTHYTPTDVESCALACWAEYSPRHPSDTRVRDISYPNNYG